MDAGELRLVMDLGKEMRLQGADLSAFLRDEWAAAREQQKEEQDHAEHEREREY